MVILKVVSQELNHFHLETIQEANFELTAQFDQ